MKKILVPIDFSEYSENALKVAATIAKEKDAEIILLHMLGLHSSSLAKSEAQENSEAIYYLKLTEKKFNELSKHTYLKDLRVKHIVQNYKVFREINEIAKEMNVNLIVMGSHGTSGITEVFVGSNTEKVVRTSDVPVLVIKENIDDFKLNDVVFACDFKTESISAYHKAIELFESFNANVHLVYVNLPHRFRNSDYVEKQAKDFIYKADSGNMANLDKVVIYNDYTVEDGLYNYGLKINADCIAIPTHGRRGLAHFFNGSIGEDLANHIDKPVMTFKI